MTSKLAIYDKLLKMLVVYAKGYLTNEQQGYGRCLLLFLRFSICQFTMISNPNMSIKSPVLSTGLIVLMENIICQGEMPCPKKKKKM